ncbi:MAG: 16S rRNA (guanine(527)-N(7))-methyltransferase RsmG [Bacteroidales bacterium]
MEELIFKYFPNLTLVQKDQFKALGPIYREWNQKINVISRKDIDNLYLHHVLHSLSIAALYNFRPESSVLDVGTGGGFPGIPLAILFPDTDFLLCDSINKKIKVVTAVSNALGLSNTTAIHTRAESIPQEFHIVVSRAVTELSSFIPWVWNKIIPSDDSQERGIIYLKGGNLNQEIESAKKIKGFNPSKISRTLISDVFKEEWFKEKEVLFIKR